MSHGIEIEGLHAGYGATRALRSVSCTVGVGEVVALIGANGAGKSTLLRCVAGLHRPAQGRIRVGGVDVTGQSAHRVARRGLCLVAEGRRLFTDLTVAENLRMGRQGLAGSAAHQLSVVHELFPILAEFADRQAGALSGGQQQMLAIGRALMREPRILLLDEPSLGLAPMLVTQILAAVRTLSAAGMTILLAEQNAASALRIADRGMVLANGVLTHQGEAGELLADDEIGRHYLGAAGPGERRGPARPLPAGLAAPLE
jgi:branched-chain amino acid transport system ATP-binding protein